jgi:multimeric flavodoxin WrbA
MKALAFNGSPRSNSTTATLLEKALEGAASQQADTDLIHLNQLTMKGCQSCFSCKMRGGKNLGKCVLNDDMTPLYEKIEGADAIFLGSPIYFGTVTAQAKLFIDRLFPYLSYKDLSSPSIFPKKISVGLFYTQHVEDSSFFQSHIDFNEMVFSMLFGTVETLISTDTIHVEDYSKLVADDIESGVDRKLKHRQEVFPKDCEKAFNIGSEFMKNL